MPTPARFEHALTVARGDIDELGHANNLAFLRWALDAAHGHTAAVGWPAEAYLRVGAGWVVRRHDIEYKRPAFEGDAVTVTTWVATMGAVTSLRRYTIARTGDAALLAHGSIEWAFINYGTGRPTRVIAEVASAFVVVPDQG